MAYEAKILKHSMSQAGVELVTFEVNYPHAVHKDVMTHRWARNFQSFRALPPEVLIPILRTDPFIPEVFGHRVKGMGQRNEPIEGQEAIDQEFARQIWMDHVRDCIEKAEKFLSLDIAKQQTNFLLQDVCWIRGIITTTMPQLENFFGLRLALDPNTGQPMARPEVYKIAKLMQDAWKNSVPEFVGDGAWHLPLVKDEEILDTIPSPMTEAHGMWAPDWDYWKKVSVGRCARVSYLTHDGVRDPEKDIALHDSLLTNGHMSPFEHQGTPISEPWFDAENVGSFGNGWRQYRKFIPHESNYLRLLQEHVDVGN